MNLAFLLSSVMAILALVASQTEPTEPIIITGGYSAIDPKSIEARRAARFGVSKTYQAGTTTFKVVTAKKQVVAGYKYDMNVAVTFRGNKSCSMQNYVVWQLPVLTATYQLVSNAALTATRCPN